MLMRDALLHHFRILMHHGGIGGCAPLSLMSLDNTYIRCNNREVRYYVEVPDQFVQWTEIINGGILATFSRYVNSLPTTHTLMTPLCYL